MLRMLVVAASAAYVYTVYKATRFTSSERLRVIHFHGPAIPFKLKSLHNWKSTTGPGIFNLRERSSTSFDTRSIDVTIPAHRRDVTDEELLSRFTKAFFGGDVIRPERFVLQTLRPNLVHFSAICSKDVPQIWSAREICSFFLIPKHTKIFGTFQVLDSCVQSEEDSAAGMESYIDIGFGNDQSSFSGVHRFSVSRLTPETAGLEQHVVLQFSCRVTSGPEPSFVASVLKRTSFLHRVYADLLFRESVGVVENWLQDYDKY